VSTATFAPSDKQLAIFRWFKSIRKGMRKTLVIRARAGTGKTTTIVQALAYVDAQLKAMVGAFGKDIQLELAKKLMLANLPAVQARTFHSLGLYFVKKNWPDSAVEYTTDRQDALALKVCGERTPEAIRKLVARLCTQARLMAPLAQRAEDLINIAIEFDCMPDEEWDQEGYDLDYVTARAYLAMQIAANEKAKIVDGADLLYLPIRNRWLFKFMDVFIVDEAQDMNMCQLLIAEGICRGTLIVVGDDRQAIYGFAGADSGSLDRLKIKHNADELPLNTTYRCGKAIVEVAKKWVPDFEAGPDNPEGEVIDIAYEKIFAMVEPGDYVLSRVNAPLTSIAMRLLKAGKRARIAGRNIGDGLVSLISKMKAKSVPDFLVKVERWSAKQTARLERQMESATNGRKKTIQSKIEGVKDQADMLIALAEGAENVSDVLANIQMLFTDDGRGEETLVTCSSVHKAKGKEANRVFVLRDTLREGGEESNIAYVAVTRAKNTLVWVMGS
jgi:superfamily I DNA/RNA helicase